MGCVHVKKLENNFFHTFSQLFGQLAKVNRFLVFNTNAENSLFFWMVEFLENFDEKSIERLAKGKISIL